MRNHLRGQSPLYHWVVWESVFRYRLQKNTITSAILGFQIRVRDLKARVGVPLLPVKCRIVTIPGTNIRLRSPVSMQTNIEKKLAWKNLPPSMISFCLISLSSFGVFESPMSCFSLTPLSRSNLSFRSAASAAVTFLCLSFITESPSVESPFQKEAPRQFGVCDCSGDLTCRRQLMKVFPETGSSTAHKQLICRWL